MRLHEPTFSRILRLFDGKYSSISYDGADQHGGYFTLFNTNANGNYSNGLIVIVDDNFRIVPGSVREIVTSSYVGGIITRHKFPM